MNLSRALSAAIQVDPSHQSAGTSPIYGLIYDRCGHCGGTLILAQPEGHVCSKCNSRLCTDGIWRKHAGPAYVKPEMPMTPELLEPARTPPALPEFPVAVPNARLVDGQWVYTCYLCHKTEPGTENQVCCAACRPTHQRIRSLRRYHEKKVGV